MVCNWADRSFKICSQIYNIVSFLSSTVKTERNEHTKLIETLSSPVTNPEKVSAVH